ncbi:hypothetical protein [Dactylosporangium sp. CA-092794]|uniref:hypothetical protein n=1 Tax=Dactylosporangium sp. CA-092794 TaxID=3239929 RepID=UPI003D950A42
MSVAEVSVAAGADDAGSAARLARLDRARYPLLIEAALTGTGTDDAARFDFALEPPVGRLRRRSHPPAAPTRPPAATISLRDHADSARAPALFHDRGVKVYS